MYQGAKVPGRNPSDDNYNTPDTTPVGNKSKTFHKRDERGRGNENRLYLDEVEEYTESSWRTPDTTVGPLKEYHRMKNSQYQPTPSSRTPRKPRRQSGFQKDPT